MGEWRNRWADKRRTTRAPKGKPRGEHRTDVRRDAEGKSVSRRAADKSKAESFVTIPKPTPETADAFVLLLHAGLDPLSALLRVLDAEREDVTNLDAFGKHVRAWLNSRVVLDATSRLNGGAWETLPAEKRLELATTKYLAEMAFFLLTHNYGDLIGSDIDKANEAFKAIQAAIKGSGSEDAFTKFAADVLAGKVQITQAPQLTPGLMEQSIGKSFRH